jgi:glutathione S-transferase
VGPRVGARGRHNINIVFFSNLPQGAFISPSPRAKQPIHSAAMRQLYHTPLCPFCRKVRLVLGEKRLEAELLLLHPWAETDRLYDLNPAGQVPVLVDIDKATLAESAAIVEYLEERHPETPVLPGGPAERAEARRLAQWFDLKFHGEVTANLLHEKVYKRLRRAGEPDMRRIRAGLLNLRSHLDYLAFLADRRNWLAGEAFSLADMAAAAHLSCLDYTGDVPWDSYPVAKEWYMRVKSRPAFRPLLADRMPGMAPAGHYAELDF